MYGYIYSLHPHELKTKLKELPIKIKRLMELYEKISPGIWIPWLGKNGGVSSPMRGMKILDERGAYPEKDADIEFICLLHDIFCFIPSVPCVFDDFDKIDEIIKRGENGS